MNTLKITIEEGNFTYTVDYNRDRTPDPDGIETLPHLSDVIDDFMKLLSNVYTKESISDVLGSGTLTAFEYSATGRGAMK